MNNLLSSTDIDKIYNTIINATDILILTHVNPDGDSVGCTSSMYSFCKRLSKESNSNIQRIIYGGIDSIPKYLSFIPNTDKYKILTDIPEDFLYNSNALILCLDCGDPYRCIPNYNHFDLNSVNIINIDHHPTNTNYGNMNYIFPAASSCCEIIGNFIIDACERNQIDPYLKELEAYSLYTGIKTDTGNFKYSSVTSDTFTATAKISKYLNPGAILDIDSKLTKTKPTDFLKVYSKIMNNISLINNNEIAIITCRKYDFTDTNVKNEDIKDILNFPFSVVPVLLTILITETDNDKFLISIRSRRPYSAQKLAIKFGGGGHEAAAGAIVDNMSYRGIISNIYDEFNIRD